MQHVIDISLCVDLHYENIACFDKHSEQRFLQRSLTAPVLERLFFHEKIPVGGFLKIPVLEEIDFFIKKSLQGK